MEEQTIPFAECSQYLYRLHKEELFDIARTWRKTTLNQRLSEYWHVCPHV